MLTARIVAYLLSEEALTLEAYKDSENIWTVFGGIATTSGYNVLQYKDNPQTIQFALEETVKYIQASYLPIVMAAFPASHQPLTEAQTAAALSFLWRNGRLADTHWVQAYNKGLFSAAKIDWMNWTNHGSELSRCARERDLFFSDIWPDVSKIGIWSVDRTTYKPNRETMVDVTSVLEHILA